MLVVEKFIHSLILYTSFLLHSRWQGSARVYAGYLGAKTAYTRGSQLTLTAHFVYHVCIMCMFFGLYEESTVPEENPDMRRTSTFEKGPLDLNLIVREKIKKIELGLIHGFPHFST